ncbi:MAG: hypothetical protein MJ223_00740 [Mycoplasmoidaceae bacterium]|nr:hypothetical protein [Mycoplasmoidaceae bacterium]
MAVIVTFEVILSVCCTITPSFFQPEKVKCSFVGWPRLEYVEPEVTSLVIVPVLLSKLPPSRFIDTVYLVGGIAVQDALISTLPPITLS